MVDERFDALKKLLEMQPEDIEPNFIECIKSVHECFADLSQCHRETLLKMILVHLDSRETDQVTQSLNNISAAVKLKTKLIFAFECRMACASNPEVTPDLQLSDWVSNVVGRLGVCIPDRRQWKQFLELEIVSRYSEMFAFTLSEVYLNLGLDPPDCLPKYTDLNASGSYNMGTPDDVHSPLFEERSPVAQTSPPCSRPAMRQFLPRAMFSDSLAVVSAASLTPLSKRTAYSHLQSSGRESQASLSCLSKAATAPSASARQAVASSSASVMPSTPTVTVTPKLVLIPSSRSRRRKGRTPTKRVAGSRRKTKGVDLTSSRPATGTANVSKRGLSETGVGQWVGSSNHHDHDQEPCRDKSSSSAAPGKRSRRRPSPTTGDRQTHGQVTPKNRRRRSVHETPNPDKSYPRWERARLAAAEKTKTKAVIVDESPVKPSTSLGSPLRRLRRANSLLISMSSHLHSSCTSLTWSQPTGDSSADGTVTTTTGSRHEVSHAPATTGRQPACLSVGMTRAERWLQRQFDEETSLSQFSASSPTHGQQKGAGTSPSGSEVILGQHTPSSGLLSRLGGGVWTVHRRSSNLFANMVSPEAMGQAPTAELVSTIVVDQNRTTEKKRAPDQQGIAACNQPTRQLSTPPRSAPRRHHHKPNLSGRIDRRRLPTSSTLPSTGTPPNKNAFSRELPFSPQVFDEDAMFLGRDEFLTRTSNTTPSGVGDASPLSRLAVDHDDEADDDGAMCSASKRKRTRLVPGAPSPLVAPVLRLNPVACTPGIDPPPASLDKPRSPRLRWTPRRRTVTRLRHASPTFPSSGRSPFAPLQVYNNPSATVCDADTATTHSNSQSASHIVAMRTNLFGGSNTNSNDTDLENVSSENKPPVPHGQDPWTDELPAERSTVSSSSGKHQRDLTLVATSPSDSSQDDQGRFASQGCPRRTPSAPTSTSPRRSLFR